MALFLCFLELLLFLRFEIICNIPFFYIFAPSSSIGRYIELLVYQTNQKKVEEWKMGKAFWWKQMGKYIQSGVKVE